MRRIMAARTDTIATATAVIGRGTDVIRTATSPLRALEHARLFLLRLTGLIPAGMHVANRCHVQSTVGVGGAARLLGSKYDPSTAWPRPVRRGALLGRS
ncbi:MAG: hypothetical protein HQ567_03405 [Candidatus Nealsonbacteria bacterium]|nr:hypothetical protein [Candidatus Nealsonbacteria bacterium]